MFIYIALLTWLVGMVVIFIWGLVNEAKSEAITETDDIAALCALAVLWPVVGIIVGFGEAINALTNYVNKGKGNG